MRKTNIHDVHLEKTSLYTITHAQFNFWWEELWVIYNGVNKVHLIIGFENPSQSIQSDAIIPLLCKKGK